MGLVALAFLACVSAARAATSASLAWDPNSEPDLAGYTVYYGNVSGQYTNAVPVGMVTNAVVPGLVEGRTYYFVVTASNTNGLESDPSNEVSYTPGGGSSPLVLSSIANQTTSEDQTWSVPFSFRPGTGGGAVNFTASSSNTNLVRGTGVVFAGSGTNRTAAITPLTNTSGSTVITLTGNDGVTTASTSFTLTVNAVNDLPTLTALSNRTINEDAAAQTVTLSGISAGAGESQTLTVSATSGNPALIPNPQVTYTSPNTTGSLTFTPVANASGSALLTVTVNDGSGGTVSQAFTVTVTPVNDSPTLAALADRTLNEDAGLQSVALSGIAAGGGESQTLTLSATSSNPSLIPTPQVTYTSPSASGTLTFTPAANASGSALITLTVNDGSGGTVSQSFSVTVTAVNDPPTLAVLTDRTLAEDAGPQSVPLTGIGAGGGETQTLTVSASSSNPSLIPTPQITYTSPSATGSLSFTPTTDASGSTVITVTVNDGNGGFISQSFAVTVTPVNDPPTLASINDRTLVENAGAQSVPLTGITAGGGENQTLTLSATSSNPSLIPNPQVSYTSPNNSGSITFTPVAGASGLALITVTVNDGSGGTTNRSFTVNVGAVNDPPTLDALADRTVNEDAGPQSVPLSGITAGGGEIQPLTVTVTSGNPSLIPNPQVTYTSPNTTGSLAFTPVANASGSALITVAVNDGNGGTVSQSFTVTVTLVNDLPTLAALNDRTILEDAGLQSVPLSGISAGGGESQALTVSATSSNPSLVPAPQVAYASPSATGTLNFTPPADASGSALITVTVNDGSGGTVSQSFTVTVTPVNDPPTLAALADRTLAEDAGPQSVPLTGIAAGGGESQTLTVTVLSSQPSLIPTPQVTYTSPNTSGTLSFTPAANASGSALITVTVNDGSGGIVSQTFTVTVNPVNDPPTLAALSARTIAEDAGPQSVPLGGIAAGAGESQTLNVSAMSSNPSLIPTPQVTYTSPDTTGSLAFTPAADASGSAIITVTVNDGNGGSTSQSFTVTVTPVNDLPTLVAPSDRNLLENAGLQSVALTGITAGGGENQPLTVSASSSNPSLIPAPQVAYTSPNTSGTLTFTPASGASGVALITVAVNDGSGGIVSRSFSVNVGALNDPPTLSALVDRTVNEDAGPQTVSLSGITAGPGESQPLTVSASSSNPSLVPNPQVAYASPSSTGSLTFTPVANASGTALITVTVNDGNGGTFSQSFTVTVTPVNDPPALAALVDRTVLEDDGLQTVPLSGISAGGGEVQPLTVNAVSSNPSLVPNPQVTYTSPNTTGSLIFAPVANASGSALITVTINDGNGGTVSQSFTVTVTAVNDPPTLGALTDRTLAEDAGSQTVPLSGIAAGGGESQALIVSASSSNPALIPSPLVTYTSPNSTGSLTFTPTADANGSALITVTVNDGNGGTLSQSFIVTVTPVNDPPTLAALTDRTLAANAGLQSVPLSGIAAGGGESQALAVSASSSNPSLVPNPQVTYTSPGTTGTLTFTPAPNAFGSALVTVTVNDGNGGLVSRAFMVTVTSPNNPPTLGALADRTLAEDAGLQSVPLTGIAAGSGGSQTLTVTALSGNPAIIPNPQVTYTSPGTTGTLTFAPAPNAFGSVLLTVNVSDGNGGTVSRSFMVTVTPVNDPPTLDALADVVIGEDSGLHTIPLHGLTPGEGENQPLTFTVSSSNPVLIVNPRVQDAGPGGVSSLTFSPGPHVYGSGLITLTANDGSGGVSSRTFQLTVASENDTPEVTPFADQFLAPSAAANLPFIAYDVETPAGSLLITWTSSNPSVLPIAYIAVTGSTSNRTLIVTAPGNVIGSALVQVTVSDGWRAASTSFNVTIGNTNTEPTNVVATVAAGAYRGLFYEETAVRHESSGAFTITTTANRSYTGFLRYGARRLEFSGKLDHEGRGSNRIRLATGLLNSTNSLLLTFQAGAGQSPDQVVGTISHAAWESGLLGDRGTFHARTNVAPYVGRYTLQLPGQVSGALGPQGDGFGAVVVSSNGLVTLTGALGDTLAMTHSSALSKEGHWPFYLPLYAGRGSILGWLNVSNRVTEDINGQLSWIKPATVTAKFFKTGFTNELFASGSRYISPPTLTNAVLNLAEAGLTFLGGNLPEEFTNVISLQPGHKFINRSTNALTMTLVPRSGLFSGRVLDPVSRRFHLFRGALFQKQNTGSGFLTGTNETSRVTLSGLP